MLDYTREAAGYDATRGGPARANAAAEAISRLLPSPSRLVADVAGGTGIVGAALRDLGHRPIVIDRSFGMAAVATTRLPGRVALGDAAALPLANASVDAVTMVWLLHLVKKSTSASAVAEAARVLRPGGALITTVDKNDGYHTAGDDIAEILGPTRVRLFHPNPDAGERIAELGARHGLTVRADATFVGFGQGRSPAAWRRQLHDPQAGWLRRGGADLVAELDQRLAELPEQDRPRADPVYRLVAYRADSP
jgi:SAM-dependent methyltransferase